MGVVTVSWSTKFDTTKIDACDPSPSELTAMSFVKLTIDVGAKVTASLCNPDNSTLRKSEIEQVEFKHKVSLTVPAAAPVPVKASVITREALLISGIPLVTAASATPLAPELRTVPKLKPQFGGPATGLTFTPVPGVAEPLPETLVP